MFFSLDLLPHNPRFTPGSMLHMTCRTHSNKCNQTSADLKFEFDFTNGKIINVSNLYVTVKDNETVELNYPNVQPHFNDAFVWCLVRSDREECREKQYDKLLVGSELMLVCFSFSFAYLLHLHVLPAISHTVTGQKLVTNMASA